MENPVLGLAAAVRAGSVSASRLVDDYLARIRAQDGALNTYLHVDEAGAKAQAEAIDARIDAGEDVGPLAGVPLGLKDIFSTAGVPTTCASKVLAGYVPPFDATVVQRLRSAGAVFLGKLNMDEFAMGSSNENSAFGPVRNPLDAARVPGGSSGGSAAAVAADLCAAALGTDTGGSIRQPAAMCGVVGFKPTYGRCSRFGVIAFASSLDQPGPVTRTVRDAALLYQVMAGVDPHDATSADAPVAAPEYGDVAGLRVGVPREYFAVDGLADGVRDAVQRALDWYAAVGATLVPVDLPSTDEAVAAYYLVATAEASSNLARYDGVRFGPRGSGADLQTMYAETRSAFGPEVKRRLLLGTFALSSGYYDAYYGKACAARDRVRADFDAAWAHCDVIAAPTSPCTAFPLGERVDDPLAMYLADVFTIPASLAGLPGISIPCGVADGLPVGLQLIGRRFDEVTVLRAAAAFEDAHR